MDFFDIGPGEILLILIVALIVFGPERLVDIGKSLGKTVHSFRKAASDLTTQVTREIEETKAAASLAPGEAKSVALPGEAKAAPAASGQEPPITAPRSESSDQH